jgi:hypothetical protein
MLGLKTEKQWSARLCVTEAEKDENQHVDLRMRIKHLKSELRFLSKIFIKPFVLNLFMRIRSALRNQWLKRKAELLIRAQARSWAAVSLVLPAC